jgi:hypothetical protein
MKKQQRQELSEEQKSKLLYDLLFNQKVDQLGNLKVERHEGYVVVDEMYNKAEQ